MASKTNKYTIQAETKGFKKAEGQTKKLGGGMKSLAKSVGGVALAYFSTQGLISGLKAVIKLAGEQELAEKKLATAFRGNTTGLKAYARQLQQVTRFGDEVVMGVMTSISAFNKDEDAIKRLTKATLDLAEGTGMDLKSAGDLVSKSIGSSTNALSRYGIEVVGAVGSTERLDSMLGNISDKFEGQATASADTMTGAVEQMQNAMGDTGEVIGSILTPSIVGFAKNTKRLFEEIGIDIELHNTQIDLSSAKYKTLSDIAKQSQIEIRMEILKTAIELENNPTMVSKVYNTWVEGMKKGSDVALGILAPNLSKVWDVLGFLNDEFDVSGKVTDKLDESMTNLSVDTEKVSELTAELTTLMAEFNAVRGEGGVGKKDDPPELTGLQELQIAYDLMKEKMDIQAEAKINQIALDLALKEGVDAVTQSHLDQARAIVESGDVTKATTEQKLKSTSQLLGGLSKLAGEHKQGALASKRLAQGQALIDTWSAGNKALASAPPPWNYIAMAGVIASGLGNVANIEAQTLHTGGLIGGGDNVPINAQGGEFVMQRDAVQSIGVESLSAMNEGGGGGITLNISAPLVDDTIIDTIVPAIDRARREGLA